MKGVANVGAQNVESLRHIVQRVRSCFKSPARTVESSPEVHFRGRRRFVFCWAPSGTVESLSRFQPQSSLAGLEIITDVTCGKAFLKPNRKQCLIAARSQTPVWEWKWARNSSFEPKISLETGVSSAIAFPIPRLGTRILGVSKLG